LGSSIAAGSRVARHNAAVIRRGQEGSSMSPTLASITVCIAVKDRPDDLKRALDSLRNQFLAPAEIIVVDDGSTQPVREDIMALFPGQVFRVLRNEKSQGAARSYNRGIAAAMHPIIAFLDSDDMFLPHYIERVSAFWQGAGRSVVCAACSFLWCLDSMRPYRQQPAVGQVTTEALLRRGNFVGGSSVFSVRREAISAVGGFPELSGSCDWALLIELSRIGTIVALPEPLVFYRSPGTTAAVTDTSKFMVQALAVFKVRRRWSEAERAVGRETVIKAIAYNAAQAGRRKLAFNMLGLLRRGGGSDDAITRRIWLICLIGSQNFTRLIRLAAYCRASLRTNLHLVEKGK
jgi:glycosyltransferase involved in cell wall biosynthesis